MLRYLSVIGLISLSCAVLAQQYTISTIAGNGTGGSTGNGAAAVNATVNYPQGMTLSADGSIYVTQPADHSIRMIDAATGNMEHVAGIGIIGYGGNGGPATMAGLAYPFGITFNADGDLFIAERDALRIRKISADGTISTFAGTLSPGNNTEVPALSANLFAPMGVRMRANGDLLLSVIGNNYVRYIDADSSYLHTLAGSGTAAFAGDNGPALSGSFNLPYDIAIANNGDIYIADANNAAVRKVDAISGVLTTVAGIGTGPTAYTGDGMPATEATLGFPQCIALDADDNLYISDGNHSRIRKVDATTGLISTIAGTTASGYNGDNMNAATALISAPCGIVIDAEGRVVFADAGNHRIRMLTPVDDTSVDENSARARISAYPSPTKEELHVRSSLAGGPFTVELLDAQGRVVIRANANTRTTLSVADLAAGIYTVRVAGSMPVRVMVQ